MSMDLGTAEKIIALGPIPPTLDTFSELAITCTDHLLDGLRRHVLASLVKFAIVQNFHRSIHHLARIARMRLHWPARGAAFGPTARSWRWHEQHRPRFPDSSPLDK